MSQSFSRRSFFKGAASLAALTGVATAFAPAYAAPKDPFIEDLIAKMSVEEKAGQLSLYYDHTRVDGTDVNPAGTNKSKQAVLTDIAKGRITGLFNGMGVAGGRELQKAALETSPHKIPLIFAADVIHGLKTIFPVPMGEAASFDPSLSRRTTRAAAVEATARGIHWTFSPMVDIARDERWGRVAEGAGEDTWLGCQFAAARVQGFQGPDIRADNSMIACLKHFAAYGAVQGGMEYNTADIPETTLRQVHLPPFKAGIDAGAITVMSSFNDIAGVPSTGNHYLLTDILRGEWAFKGLVVSDYTSEEELILHGFAADGRDAAKKAIMAGCDMSMESGIYMKYLPDLVNTGEVPLSVLDEAVRRVLWVKKQIGLFDNPYRSLDLKRETTQMRMPATIALAREAARRSCVLLKNDGDVLPLKKAGQTIALIGPLASDRRNLSGSWVVWPDTNNAVTVEAGMRTAMKDGTKLILAPGCDIEAAVPGGIADAVRAAKTADVAVLCLGEAENMSGEAQSRTDIVIPDAQIALAEAIAAIGKPMVVLLSSGRALELSGAVRDAPAIMATWFLGSEAGNGIADLLFGDYSPSGRLPVSFPQRSGQEPFYYNHRTTGRPQTGDDKNYKARYREVTFEPLYPFGHGLGYARAIYGDTQVSSAVMVWDGAVTVTTTVTNTGARAVHEVAQIYIRDRVASLTQPIRALKGIMHLDLKPGETRTVSFDLMRADLAFINADLKLRAEAGDFDVWISPSSGTGTSARLSLLAG